MDHTQQKNTLAVNETNKNDEQEDSNDSLLPLLKRIKPTISSYKSLNTVTQANAEGNRILVSHDDDDDDQKEQPTNKKEEIFVKKIDVARYSHKSWNDLRRTLLYARTEVRFYNEILPLLRAKLSSTTAAAATTSNNDTEEVPILAPKCYHAECNLFGLIAEDEQVLGSCVNNDSPMLDGRGGTIVLQALSTTTADSNQQDDNNNMATTTANTTYHQSSPLSLSQAKQCLVSLAKLHASAWEDKSILEPASDRLSLGSYHLSIRNPKELANIIESWEGFLDRFQNDSAVTSDINHKAVLGRKSVQNLGRRVKDMATYISKELTPGFKDEYATIVHGDYKAMNVFLPVLPEKNNNDEHEMNAIMIDFASTGVGLGMSDVAMHIIHAVNPSDQKRDDGEGMLIDAYLQQLHQSRSQIMQDSSENDVKVKVKEYTKEVAMRHYKLATVDYFRFVLGRFWKTASPDSFQQKKFSQNTTLVNRDLDAAIALIDKVDLYLKELEMERRD